MRVVTVVDIGHPVVGGTQITHQSHLRLLARHFGHACTYLDRAVTAQRPRRGEIRCDSWRDPAELRAKLARAEPDVVLAAFTSVAPVIRLGRRLGVPVVACLNSYEYCPPSPAEAQRWQLGMAHRLPSAEERDFALSEADALVVNSEHLLARLRSQTDRDAHVVYPSFDPRSVLLPRRARREPRTVTGLCGHPHKGAALFLELARRLPDARFLVVGAVHADFQEAFRAQPNLSLWPFGPLQRFLACSKVLLVPSQWDEPFGRIAVEAMANDIPLLASRRAGLAEIVGDTPLGVGAYRSVDAWEAALRPLLGNAARAARHAALGRTRARGFLGLESVVRLEALLRRTRGRAAGRRSRARERAPERVVAIAGDPNAKTAFSLVNQRLGGEASGRTRILPSPGTRAFLPEAVDVHVHHALDEPFPAVEPPEDGFFVAYRTWDFGPFPKAWVDKIERECDQLWLYSRWVQRQAIAGGVRPGRTQVVPLGADPAVFHPDGPALPLPTERRFRFLFAGASVLRKGFDILLEAYGRAFGPEDDVCLVVKDQPRDVFYAGQRLGEALARRRADPRHPEIVHVDRFLPEEQLAALYRACDVGVFPYRAEGFALPILEAMACGTPSIVPRFGACLDYCAQERSWLVPARRIALPVLGDFAFNALGFRERVDEVDFCEVDVDVLARALREVYASRSPGRSAGPIARRGRAGARFAHARFTWAHSLARIERALDRLDGGRVPVRMRLARRDRARHRDVFEAARALFLDAGCGEGLPVREERGR